MLQSEELNRVFLDLDINANWYLRTFCYSEEFGLPWLKKNKSDLANHSSKKAQKTTKIIYNPLWETNRELARIEAKRLQTLLPKLGKALIMKSNDKGSYHVRFPDARLTKAQELNVLIHSLSHRGHVWFSFAVGDTALRVSTKSKGKVYEPYLVEVVPVE